MKKLLLIVCFLAVTACEDDPATGGGPISVNSVNGTVVMSGVWISNCFNDGTDGFIQTYSFNGSTLTSTTATYSGDTGCGNTPANIATDLSLATGGDQSVGWVITAPGGLASNVTGTRVSQTILTLVTKFTFFVDDSAVPNILYIGTPAATLDGDGYPTELLDSIPYTKQ